MDFFARQDQARRQTRWLLVLFGLAVIVIVLAVDTVVLALAEATAPSGAGSLAELVQAHREPLLWSTLLTGGGMLLASVWRMLRLRRGGGTLAWEVGAEAVDPATDDPGRRRLINVAEEMALAAGIPVPGLYVLAGESGINAFAAGHGPPDAVIVVTRGALEQLPRAELQGVVAHEIAHIVHGDVRLNLRLMGWLFGITRVSRLGALLLSPGRRRHRGRSHPALFALGLALLVVGYLGHFLARCLRAAVSRQREFLADAGAVQFTRLPDGLAAALKRLARGPRRARLAAGGEDLAHMLFAAAPAGRLLASHPPLVARIEALEPGFDPASLGSGEDAAEPAAAAAGTGDTPTRDDAPAAASSGDTPARDDASGAAAPGFLAALPVPLVHAAHAPALAPALVAYLMLAGAEDAAESGRLEVARRLGHETEDTLRHLLAAAPELPPEARLPLLDIAFPALRQAPAEARDALAALADGFAVRADADDVLGYAVARVVAMLLRESEAGGRRPGGPRAGGPGRLRALRQVLAVLAEQGAGSSAAAARAYAAGLAAAGLPEAPRPAIGELWRPLLDSALARLDGLPAAGKRRVLHGLEAVVAHDQSVDARERALMRVIAARLHIPVSHLPCDGTRKSP